MMYTAIPMSRDRGSIWESDGADRVMSAVCVASTGDVLFIGGVVRKIAEYSPIEDTPGSVVYRVIALPKRRGVGHPGVELLSR